MKLDRKKMLLISFMLFSLFFGAGNLIFPPFLGQNAGSSTVSAMLGFLATAVILPVLGVIVVARFDGLEQLAQHAGKKFSLIFTVLIYLSIGPGLGIPRAASVPFEMAVAPYLPQGANIRVWMVVYSLVFFLIALWLCMTPGKLVEFVGVEQFATASRAVPEADLAAASLTLEHVRYDGAQGRHADAAADKHHLAPGILRPEVTIRARHFDRVALAQTEQP